jgi:hypothetical protein
MPISQAATALLLLAFSMIGMAIGAVFGFFFGVRAALDLYDRVQRYRPVGD